MAVTGEIFLSAARNRFWLLLNTEQPPLDNRPATLRRDCSRSCATERINDDRIKDRHVLFRFTGEWRENFWARRRQITASSFFITCCGMTRFCDFLKNFQQTPGEVQLRFHQRGFSAENLLPDLIPRECRRLVVLWMVQWPRFASGSSRSGQNRSARQWSPESIV